MLKNLKIFNQYPKYYNKIQCINYNFQKNVQNKNHFSIVSKENIQKLKPKLSTPIKEKSAVSIDLELARKFVSPEYKNQSNSKIIAKESQQEKHFKKEQQSLKINSRIFKREIFNDSVQLPIKYLAYTMAGSNTATFWAEFVRSGIDAINHLIIFGTNFINVRPTKEYPYGLDKIKNVVVIVPATLFLLFGCETIYSEFSAFFYPSIAETVAIEGSQNQSMYSVLLYLVSLGVELSVISYNLIDVYRSQNQDKKEEKINIMTIMKALVQKKDPLLQVILFENAITLTSMSIPLMCGIAAMFYPPAMFEFIGATTIGIIQLSCGYHLAKENIYPLIGRGIPEEEVNEIKAIVKHNKYIEEVDEEKAILIGHETFRFFAEVTFNVQKLSQLILNEYSLQLENIVYNSDYEEREEELKELLVVLPVRLLREIQIQKDLVEDQILKKFPNCIHIDLELDQENLLTQFSEDESLKNFFFQSLLQTKNNKTPQKKQWKELEQFNQTWIDQDIEKYLDIDIDELKSIIINPSQLTPKQQKQQQDFENLNSQNIPYQYDREQEKFYSQHFSSLYVEEHYLVNEKYRNQSIQEEVNHTSDVSMHWQNIEDPFQDHFNKYNKQNNNKKTINLNSINSQFNNSSNNYNRYMYSQN